MCKGIESIETAPDCCQSGPVRTGGHCSHESAGDGGYTHRLGKGVHERVEERTTVNKARKGGE